MGCGALPRGPPKRLSGGASASVGGELTDPTATLEEFLAEVNAPAPEEKPQLKKKTSKTSLGSGDGVVQPAVGFLQAESGPISKAVVPGQAPFIGFLQAECAGKVKRSSARSNSKGSNASAKISAAFGFTHASEEDTQRWNAHKEKRKKKKMLGKVQTKSNLLSTVADLAMDIQYRFRFIVVGDFAEMVVESVCTSDEAPKYSSEKYGSQSEDYSSELSGALGHSESYGSTDPTGSQSITPGNSLSMDSTLSNKLKLIHRRDFRTVCPVPYPMRVMDPKQAKFAKLIFEPLSFTDTVPTCSTLQEASSCSLVFCIMVDRKEGAGATLEEQLAKLTLALKKRRKQKKALRASWAVILCHEHPIEGNKLERQPWDAAIDEFERLHGSVWRFGAMGVQEPDELYSAFAKIASHRIYAEENPDGYFSHDSLQSPGKGSPENSGSAKSNSGPLYGAEQEFSRPPSEAPLYCSMGQGQQVLDMAPG